MIRPTAETLLISAMINTGDVSTASLYNVTPEMFVGFPNEYRWILSYPKAYGSSPTKETFLTKFPSFPFADTCDVAFAADEVKYAYTKRGLVRAIQDSTRALTEGDLEEAIMAVSGFAMPSSVVPLKNTLSDISFLDTYELEEDILRIGWPTLLRATSGIRPGDLWYLAARLGQGKSWLLGSLAADALIAGRRVIFYSLEMSQRQVQTRMHTILAKRLGIDIRHSQLHGRTYDALAYRRLVGRISDEIKGELFVVDSSLGRVSPATIQAQADQADLVVVDYAGLLSTPMGNRAIDDWRSMASISNQLKEVAVATGTPIISAAQINRDGDGAGWKPPKVKNLAQSDALGQDADVVITHKRYSKSTMISSIEKNRHGASGDYFWTNFSPEDGRFDEITRDQADNIKDNESDGDE